MDREELIDVANSLLSFGRNLHGRILVSSVVFR